MNKKMMYIVIGLVLVLIAALVLRSCGKAAQKAEITVPDETKEAATAETTVAAEDTVAETTEETTDDTVILGMSEEDAATETTIPLEDRPVVTTPAIQEAQAPTDYETYLAMSGEEQQAFVESFDSMEAFFAWFTAAKEEYESTHQDIEINGDEVIKFN